VDARIRARAAQFWAARMLTGEWFAPGNGMHTLVHASPSGEDAQELSTYAVRRPDGRWSVLVINKGARPRRIGVDFAGERSISHFVGAIERITFGSAQYVWRKRGPDSMPSPDAPPATTSIVPHGALVVPAESLTVFRGRIGS